MFSSQHAIYSIMVREALNGTLASVLNILIDSGQTVASDWNQLEGFELLALFYLLLHVA